jgi:hypothetical protein
MRFGLRGIKNDYFLLKTRLSACGHAQAGNQQLVTRNTYEIAKQASEKGAL